MSKTIESPVKEFPGTVTLPKHLTMPQALAYESAVRRAMALNEEGGSQSEYDAVMVEAICECVEEWELEGFEQLSPDTFPFTPRKPSIALIAWLFDALTEMYNPEVPKE